jgi:hypothetical protein
MTKTLNQIIIFFLHQNQNIFFSNIGNQNIFLEKKPITPPLQVKWSVPKDQCKENKFNVPKHREIVSDILDSFNYLGSCIITEGGAERDIKVKIGKARSVLD